MTTVRRRVIVSGRVQGVFFRGACERVAVDLGVHGSVRNRRDGTVEVIVEGAQEAVEQLVDWCRMGPRQANVTGVEVVEEQPTGELGFVVRF